jgi:hypothetical protein
MDQAPTWPMRSSPASSRIWYEAQQSSASSPSSDDRSASVSGSDGGVLVRDVSTDIAEDVEADSLELDGESEGEKNTSPAPYVRCTDAKKFTSRSPASWSFSVRGTGSLAAVWVGPRPRLEAEDPEARFSRLPRRESGLGAGRVDRGGMSPPALPRLTSVPALATLVKLLMLLELLRLGDEGYHGRPTPRISPWSIGVEAAVAASTWVMWKKCRQAWARGTWSTSKPRGG